MNEIELSQEIVTLCEMWSKIQGVTFDQTKFKMSFHMAGSLTQLDVKNAFESIQFLTREGEFWTAVCVLRKQYDQYVSDSEVSLSSLLGGNSEKTFQDLMELKAYKERLFSPELNACIEPYKTGLKKFGDRIKADQDKLSEFLDDTICFGMSSLAAIELVENMSWYQYSRGETDDEPFAVVSSVLRFPNMESAAKFVTTREGNFVALFCVEDEDGEWMSTFGFLAKCGKNTFSICNDMVFDNPIQKNIQMSRGGQAKMFDRFKDKYADFLPYQLVGELKNKEKLDILATLKDLTPANIAWYALASDYIKRKIRKGYQLEENTCFAILTEEPKLLESAKLDAVVRVSSNAIATIDDSELFVSPERLTAEDMTAEATKGEWEREPTGCNRWLEDRYEDQVPDILFNPEETLTLTDTTKLLPASFRGGSVEDKEEAQKNDKLVHQTTGIINQRDFFGRSKHDAPPVVSVMMNYPEMGTQSKIKHSRKFVARYNKAQMIRYHTMKEYLETREAVFKKLAKIADKNFERLLRLIPLFEDEQIIEKADIGMNIFGPPRKLFHRFVRFNEGDYSKYGDRHATVRFSDYDNYRSCYPCALTGCKSRFFYAIMPYDAEHMAELLDCEVSDFPEVLQHFCVQEPYTGNHILDDIDPMEWMIENPWNKRISFEIALSKRGLNRVMKKYGPKQEKGHSNADEKSRA